MSTEEFASTKLFSDRASYYARYRPSYPQAILDMLRRLVPPPADVADVAAGTGILSRALAESGYATVAVEPNPAMRGEILDGAPPTLTVVEGTGEDTRLTASGLDLIAVAQAFHWLEPVAALREFRRIGRPNCLVAIVWNTRQFTATEFMRDYRAMLLEHAPDYERMKAKWANLREGAKAFFPSWTLESAVDNTVRWDRDTFLGNLWSVSYVPPVGTDGHDEIAAAANDIFDRHSGDGHVDFVLTTMLVVGPLG
ncbi:MAG TPA: class I SAM-dependent methyltransferase [Amycolatopsis sp.]|uniref:class I SAM-dependent methyltransferase n=1 Tax=Amycolatopsis sp. TaxID=37632 RepID=UPI002B4637C6|nr:class I SAM-dependent methyltransferase [Amycolatopsis sp.]HKS46429.1 class I SAM-dependent methyltransferase [Amycolatopsis sp.]